ELMAIAISPSGIFDIRFFLPRAVSFPLPQPSTDNRADHPRWYVGHRDCLRLRCGVAETQLRLSAAMLVHPMIRGAPALGVRDLPFACFTSAKGNVASSARTQIGASVTRAISDKRMSAEEWSSVTSPRIEN